MGGDWPDTADEGDTDGFDGVGVTAAASAAGPVATATGIFPAPSVAATGTALRAGGIMRPGATDETADDGAAIDEDAGADAEEGVGMETANAADPRAAMADWTEKGESKRENLCEPKHSNGERMRRNNKRTPIHVNHDRCYSYIVSASPVRR